MQETIIALAAMNVVTTLAFVYYLLEREKIQKADDLNQYRKIRESLPHYQDPSEAPPEAFEKFDVQTVINR